MFQKTTATDKISHLARRIRGVSGGTSASKTISILLWLIDYAQTRHNRLISVVSETMPQLRKGAMRDFEMIMKEHGYWNDRNWNATNSIYTFSGTDCIMEFFSADQGERVRGPRRDVLFLNEANNVNYEVYTQLEIRTREVIWLDWNPVSEFWFYTEVKGANDVDFLILTYKDNEALEQSIIDSLEKRRSNKNWWLVYGEGQLGEAEGRIYTGWLELDDIPPEARLERYGQDYGYTNDPTAIVGIYKWNNAYIWDEVAYLKGLSNKNIFDIYSNIPRALIVADSAEPKSNDELRGYGLNIVGAQKGQGSVMQGIQHVQEQVIYVTKRSTNIWKEYRNYLWMTDKDGKVINVPQDFLNHTLDAGRYGMDSFQPKVFKMPSDVGGVKPYLEGLLA